ncbi:hypothetical protein ABGB12_25565 [Actinocorallia sp. B10E7]|uniref:hypothetical protein n=1 Tax=Actinocorallia sp. B10E7 TaxID=3153558 RepID=UPI00325E2F2B
MLEVLNALAIKGLAEVSELTEATGRPEHEVAAVLSELEAAGHVRLRKGRIKGWTVTAEGKARRQGLLRDALAGSEAIRVVEDAYTAFLPVNGRFKQACSRWQADQDAAAARESLALVHGQVTPLLAAVSAAVPRFGRYEQRLAEARRRFESGESGALTAPRQRSYHDAWMELHADLLATLGRSRTAADG